LHYLETFPQIQEFLVLIQKEEAERLSAPSGTKLYGPPAIKIQYFAEAQMVGQVSRNVFYPHPSVDSTLLRITRTPIPTNFSNRETGQFFAFIHLSFRHRRKTLFNNLRSAFPQNEYMLQYVFSELGLPLKTRAEALKLSQFLSLFTKLSPKLTLVDSWTEV
jgi:16S rRNA (adenine1518-N6/adenine1519-N6)-dimethyltransferase